LKGEGGDRDGAQGYALRVFEAGQRRGASGMKSNSGWRFVRLLLSLALPLIYSANAGAAVFNTDGATHNPTTGGWDLPTSLGAGP
jgi:hypothetical protein